MYCPGVRPLSRFLVRAPLLPVVALRNKKIDEPLFEKAVREKKGARDRYRRRAAFRPTPHGLWAGVLMGTLGAKTRIDTGAPRAQLFVSHGRLWEAARARLNDPDARLRSKIRIAPSLIHDQRQASWLAFGEDGSAEALLREAELDETLLDLIDHAREWIAWPTDFDDEFLLQLIDDGFLVSDLEPPLVGPPPPRCDEIDHAVLTFDGEITLARSIVERAARLAPILHRLQQVMAPPVAERAQLPAVDVVSELFGSGALDLASLARGEYGVLLESMSSDAPPIPSWLLERILTEDAQLDSAELDELLPPSEIGPTCELFLQPTKNSRDWLLGLHAPAGATWGRFAHALGQPMIDALDELADAERAARPGEEFLDLAFAPTRALADLASHPPLRNAALALIGWPDRAVAVDSLSLVTGGPELGLRVGEQPVRPSPLHRLRSATAPDGVHRLLSGWSLERQHAPWAFTWGPLSSLPRLPRVTLDEFVIAPASWRLPPPKTNLKKWRRDLGVPRFVQVGEEDELLFVDLDEKNPLDKLRGRVWEIWPPLDEGLDRCGRRIEAVIALAAGDSEVARAQIAATAAAGVVAPPAVEGPATEWLSFKLFGAPDRADAVLHAVIAPLVEEARRAGELVRWFFLRYVDPPGRPHLRLRFLGDKAALAARLEACSAPAREAGDVVLIERNDYFREYARYGRDAYPTLEKLFEIDSDLALSTLGQEVSNCLLTSMDGLASQLDLDERRRLAAELRRATEDELDEDLAPEYRARQKEFLELLRDRPAINLPPFDRALLPALLHLAAVRRDPSSEARTYYFWERALDSLSHQR
jgi:thiopeptide-type bacteriocin biosynthesis protein